MPCDSDEALDQGHRAPWLIIQALCSCTRGQRTRPSCRDRRRSPGRHLALGLAALERLKEPNSRSQMPAECTRRPLKLAERRCAAKPAAGRAGGAPGGGLCFCSFSYENLKRFRFRTFKMIIAHWRNSRLQLLEKFLPGPMDAQIAPIALLVAID